ncbi:MAG TPA: hypothetical protein VGF24_01115 [Vicinamibacterales bacterium]|jgi:hypothetical protein
MSDNNGNGDTGGNSSVFWEIRHGSAKERQKAKVHDGDGLPGSGYVKVDETIQGHDKSTIKTIGTPDHPGMFRVRLRFRDEDLPKLTSTEQTWIQQNCVRIKDLASDSWFLVINVPAIERKPDAKGDWPKMPWEIHWEW